MPVKEKEYENMYALERYLRFGYGLLISAPLYMAFYVPSHTNPWNKNVYKNDKEFYQGIQTAIWMSLWVSFLLFKFPLLVVIDAYLIPVVFFGYWLFLVTMLHHTAPSGKYFDDKDWTFLKGAETTYDRNYGWLIEHLHHNIGTHVIHHIFFQKVPHYHLVQATEATKDYLKDFRKDETHVGIREAFETAVYKCRWAIKSEDEDGDKYVYMS
jgi:acyl-lipid omega-3 desaturase